MTRERYSRYAIFLWCHSNSYWTYPSPYSPSKKCTLLTCVPPPASSCQHTRDSQKIPAKNNRSNLHIKSIEKVHFSAMLGEIFRIISSCVSGLKILLEKYTIVYFMATSSALLTFCFSFQSNGNMKQKSAIPTKPSLATAFRAQAVMPHWTHHHAGTAAWRHQHSAYDGYRHIPWRPDASQDILK